MGIEAGNTFFGVEVALLGTFLSGKVALGFVGTFFLGELADDFLSAFSFDKPETTLLLVDALESFDFFSARSSFSFRLFRS